MPPPAPSYPELYCCRGWVGRGKRGAGSRGVLPGMITYASGAHCCYINEEYKDSSALWHLLGGSV
eukprot:4282957-Pleurochrysis_carterae.AAC.1